MARRDARLRENVPGEFYVDESCIDCGSCRWIAPQVFAASDRDLSFVHRQPVGDADRQRAAMALVACPTSSIGTEHKMDVAAAVRAFPDPIAPDVYYCGFAAASSYGASSYLIRRPAGNVLVDSPRASRPLFARIEGLGGARWMFLTHRDDVADHRAFRRRFGCDRVLHRADRGHDTRDVERLLDGDDPIRLGDDLLAIPVPGHTRGSAALLFRDEVLFTGDHLWGGEDGLELEASRSLCWYSWPAQRRSLERLLGYRFRTVLPGHGRPFLAPSAAAMRARLEELLARLG